MTQPAASAFLACWLAPFETLFTRATWQNLAWCESLPWCVVVSTASITGACPAFAAGIGTASGTAMMQLAVEGLGFEDQRCRHRRGGSTVGVHPLRLVGVGDQEHRLVGGQEGPDAIAAIGRHAAVGDQEVERRGELGRLGEIVEQPYRQAARHGRR